MLIDGQLLSPFEARDDDAGVFGDVTFSLTSDSDDHLSFEMVKLDRKQSELRVVKQMEERTYTVSFSPSLRRVLHSLSLSLIQDQR